MIKITGNRETFRKLPDIMDYETSGTLTGETTIGESAEGLFRLILETASGKPCMAEENGTFVMAIEQKHPGN